MLIRTLPIDVRQQTRWLLAQFATGLHMDAAQRRHFEQACAPRRLRHFLYTGLYSVLLFNLFLLSDQLMVPDVYELAVVSRLYVLTPVVLGVVAAGFMLRSWWLAHAPPWLTETLAMLGTMGVSISLGVVMLNTHSPLGSVYAGGLVPVVMFANLVQRLRFRFAVAATLVSLGVCMVALVVRLDTPSPFKVLELPVAVLLWMVAIYALMSNFNLEMDERQRFLQAERARALRTQLEQTHDDLRRASRLDALTGLPNRRQFDEFLAAQIAAQQATPPSATPGRSTTPPPLAVLLIDVDHFKAFNDRYGHPAGDQCLRLVATALSDTLPGDAGLLARWGGEEFALLLPGTDAEHAMALGRRLCQAVARLAMRHETSATADHVTISCGVACGPPVRSQRDAELMMQAADAALYNAKDQGRNRCCLAPA
jgi:diguanylate cyclase (GGDEF)-like protein